MRMHIFIEEAILTWTLRVADISHFNFRDYRAESCKRVRAIAAAVSGISVDEFGVQHAGAGNQHERIFV